MRYAELDEYIGTLSGLKEKYSSQINVHIGLEIEYFPHFDQNGYYQTLRENPGLEILLLGQHMAETAPNKYTFSWSNDRLDIEEYIALGNAEIQGINSGYFQAAAHPDRIFRRQKKWTDAMSEISDQIIAAARKTNIPLEINEESKMQSYHYWPEFWDQVDGITKIYGLDAHSIEELERFKTISSDGA